MKTLAILLCILFVILFIFAAIGVGPGFLVGHKPHAFNLGHAVLYAILAILCAIWYRMSGSATSAR